MKILLLVIGKTDEKYLMDGMDKYRNRLKHYIGFDYEEIPDIKNRKSLSEPQQKKLEGDLILSKVKAGDKLVLLDDKGKDYSSIAFSKHLQQQIYFEIYFPLKLYDKFYN
jgi:23S rRNA (pseudouridine1915-N3)-methyltransferase